MKRWLTIAAAAALLAVPVSAEAGGCVLATDPAGDAGAIVQFPRTGPQHDLRRLAVVVTPTTLVLRTSVERLSTETPPFGAGDFWSVVLTTNSGEIGAGVQRTYRRDSASAVFAGKRFDVSFRIDEAAATITVELPYARLGLRRGDPLTQVRAVAGPFIGVDRDREEVGHYSVSSRSDEAESTRSIVVGVGCR